MNDLIRTVYEFYDKREYPTASKLRKIMDKKIGFYGSQSSILILFRKMGFRLWRSVAEEWPFLTFRSLARWCAELDVKGWLFPS
jgi:hypothetical protein